MRQLNLFSILFFCNILFLQAQFPDNTWLLGYSGGFAEQDSFGLTQLNFTKNQLDISPELEVYYRFEANNTQISNKEGELQFYFNGQQVFNNNHELMENGGGMYLGTSDLGYDQPQASLILPMPEYENKYIIINSHNSWSAEHGGTFGDKLYYSIINMEENNGAGRVVIKNQLLIDDVLDSGKLTATRHANGRDWWMVWPLRNSNRFLRFEITPDGISRLNDQVLLSDEGITTGLGQVCYAPDGEKLVFFNTISLDVGLFVDVFDFDRCTGLLSDHVKMHFSHDGGAGGVAISPSSRYLYIPSLVYIYQFDLWAGDIEASKDTVAVYDGFADPLPVTFFMTQLARDGKIYISASNSTKKLGVIEYPDRGGMACNVRQHSIQLPVRNAFGIPTFPNHRLGPIDGNPCDTLGIDNIPLSNFRSDQDTSDYLSFYFQDLTAYEPAEWFWDFGDGFMSQDTSPVHIYQQDGVYPVCLTVTNENGSDTWCDTLYLGTVNTNEELILDIQPQVFPNPFQDQFSFVLHDYYPKHAELVIFDGLGRRLHHQRIFQGWNTVNGDDWASGVYFWELWDGGLVLESGKVVRL